MLARRQAAGRLVERLVEASQTQREVVEEAEQHFADTDKRARQMARAVELDDERTAAARRQAEERRMEDAMIAVAAGRKNRSDSGRQGGSR